jgi:hypothetical protein
MYGVVYGVTEDEIKINVTKTYGVSNGESVIEKKTGPDVRAQYV